MAIAVHQFHVQQRYESIDELPDFRSDVEQVASPLQIYDHTHPEISYAERQAKNALDISGAWVKVYPRLHTKPAPGTPEDTWDEQPTPLYGNAIPMKAFFAPDSQHIELTKWGIDASALKVSVVFVRSSLIKCAALQGASPSDQTRLIRDGDQIEIPYNDVNESKFPMRLDVIDAANEGNFRYRWLYWRCVCQVSTNDEMHQVKHD